jgi:hypothetical protein
MTNIQVYLVSNMIHDTVMSAHLAYRNIVTPTGHSPETKENIIIAAHIIELEVIRSTITEIYRIES